MLPGGPPAAQSALLDGAPGGPGSSASASGSSAVQRIPFDAKLRALARVFEAASEASKVDFPLCAECAAEVHRELEAQLAELQQVGAAGRAGRRRTGPAEVERHRGRCSTGAPGPASLPLQACQQRSLSPSLLQEVAAYEAALARLEAEGLCPLEERTFQARLAEAEAEAQHERWAGERRGTAGLGGDLSAGGLAVRAE